MGQSVSSQQSQRNEFRQRIARPFSQTTRDRQSSGPLIHHDPSQSDVPISGADQSQERHGSRRLQSLATFSRQISAQSVPVRDSLTTSNGDAAARDQIFYEQQEERPLMHMEELGMRNAPITHITASPMPRRLSTLSRLGSRVMSRHPSSDTPDADDANHGERRSARQRLSEHLPSRLTHERPSGNRRFSMLSSLPLGSDHWPRPGHRRDHAQISEPLPILADESGGSPNLDTSFTSTTPEVLDSTSVPLHSRRRPPPRSSRLSRLRRSLSVSLETVLPPFRHASMGRQTSSVSPHHPFHTALTDGPDHLLPPLSATDASIDFNSPPLTPPLPLSTEPVARGFPTVTEASERLPLRAEGSSWSERWAERGIGSRREPRRMQNMLRGRSSRLVRRQDEGPLPRILHLAAVAIAAQLSGNPEQAIPNLQAVGPDGLNDSLNNLFRTLQDAANTRTDARTPEDSENSSRTVRALPPLNFLRVFRFINSGTESRVPSDAPNSGSSAPHAQGDFQASGNANPSNTDDARTVTLVVVGVRSVPSDNIGHEDVATAGPNLDDLLNSPFAPANTGGLRRQRGAGGLLRHSDGRSRLSGRRPTSVDSVNSFPANYDSQRHHRLLSSPHENLLSPTPTASSLPLALSELPSGPHPPPSTPAEPTLSPYASGSTTPTRRPSSASALDHPQLPAFDPLRTRQDDDGLSSLEGQDEGLGHQRRRSDSEFARHRDLGAGAARRNGVVEPVGVESEEARSLGSRSWLIYVVGTNLAEDHPALTTPSLFTDNPTYEDMLMLSSLLGPARPPVASREDVASARGVYRLEKLSENLVASALLGAEHLSLVPGEQCRVCLAGYEEGQEVRQLEKCTHLFHRECIDEWLTTGRNSCPLCRRQGVEEKQPTPTE